MGCINLNVSSTLECKNEPQPFSWKAKEDIILKMVGLSSYLLQWILAESKIDVTISYVPAFERLGREGIRTEVL